MEEAVSENIVVVGGKKAKSTGWKVVKEMLVKRPVFRWRLISSTRYHGMCFSDSPACALLPASSVEVPHGYRMSQLNNPHRYLFLCPVSEEIESLGSWFLRESCFLETCNFLVQIWVIWYPQSAHDGGGSRAAPASVRTTPVADTMSFFRVLVFPWGEGAVLAGKLISRGEKDTRVWKPRPLFEVFKKNLKFYRPPSWNLPPLFIIPSRWKPIDLPSISNNG